METTSTNRISTIIKATGEALGVDAILEKVADLIRVELELIASVAGVATSSESQVADTAPCESIANPVAGLPSNASWTKAPTELPVKKLVMKDVQFATDGVVLRSELGQLYFANYDRASKTLNVPSGFRTSRSKSTEHVIPSNGAYRWRLVGFVEGPSL
ncbi:MAG: hypothetical protein KF743_07125 [Fimbriimonadaceae bacterium]|nr:hypothetical protein [Fimbriimonadaceae bacterium]